MNGEVTGYDVVFDSFVHLKDDDRILLTTPPTVGFSPSGISCEPSKPEAKGVTKVSCETVDDHSFAVSLQKIDQEAGTFSFTVNGMQNPPNFRKSDLFSNIYMETFDYYKI